MSEITEKQKALIEDMNEFCTEKFDFNNKTRKDASDYIDRNMKEFRLQTMDSWQLQYM